jgi:coproporphyrinogen III oxidase-like Fe-S oxidoreductase
MPGAVASALAGPVAAPAQPAAASATGRGKQKKKRAAAGPDDGRRKRAEVVKKVMKEKGMKMIEASKYVKEHGLYKS